MDFNDAIIRALAHAFSALICVAFWVWMFIAVAVWFY